MLCRSQQIACGLWNLRNHRSFDGAAVASEDEEEEEEEVEEAEEEEELEEVESAATGVGKRGIALLFPETCSPKDEPRLRRFLRPCVIPLPPATEASSSSY